MKPFALLVILVLAAALSPAGASDFRGGVEPREYGYGDGYAENSGFPGGYRASDSGGAPPQRPAEDTASTQRGGRLWVPAPPARPEGWEQDRYNPGPYPSGGSQSGVPSLYEHMRPGSSQFASDGMGQGSVDGRGATQEGAVEQGQYRFRGDDEPTKGSGSGETLYQGFRFRPQTARERQRGATRPRWRPTDEDRNRGKPPPPRPPVSGMDQSYGNSGDDWFSRRFRGGAR